MNSCTRAAFTVLAGLHLLLTCSCSTLRDYRRLSWVKEASPQLDCEAAIRRGELRFYAVNGIGSEMVVGTDPQGADRRLVEKHGIRTIAGTSDTGDHRLNQLASEYASTYNAALLRYLRARPRETQYKRRLAVALRQGTRRALQAAFPEIRVDGGPRTIGMCSFVTPGERAENYRLDREFCFSATFRKPGDTSPRGAFTSSSPKLSENAIDALLFGSATVKHSPKDQFVEWRLSYNPLPPGYPRKQTP